MKTILPLCLLLIASTVHAQDSSLHDFLIAGEGWQEAVTGFEFTDGLASDPEGNLYFSDVKTGKGIYKLGLDGKVSLIVDNLPGVSGVHLAADGRIYACQYKAGRVLEIAKDGTLKELLSGVQPNDLIVTSTGYLYFTETSTGRIHCIEPDGKTFVADEGHVIKPNGITLSVDQTTLAVSEHGGKNVWTWQIQPDGKLAAASPYMTLQISPNNVKKAALGDGATTDAKARTYVTSELGVQVFDPSGRLSGIIQKPVPATNVTSAEFAGEGHAVLFVTAGSTIWKRKLNTKGAWR